MPVGTLATVKGISTEQLLRTGAEMVLSNTYHLHLQPGEEVVAGAGGLHQFMGWQGPILTDSGGFQVFSLGELNRIDDRGVMFRNPRDGRMIDMTPEHAVAIQMALGADGHHHDRFALGFRQNLHLRRHTSSEQKLRNRQ